MTKLRLLHLVFLSTGALLLLKGIGLVASTGFVLTPVMQASAQDAAPADEPAADEVAGAGEAETGADAEAPQTAATGLGDGALPPSDGTNLQPDDLGRSKSERVVLERLRARRKELDEREARQQLREDLLKAAEARIEQRVAELKDLEQRIGLAVDEKEKKEQEEFMNLARMYETMRAKDAARIFDRLELSILVKVARAMKPAKVADVMAKMSADAAERLTVELATGGKATPAAMPAGELPKIRGN